MKKVLGFAGSTSKASINKQLVGFAGTQLENIDFDMIDLNDFPVSLFSVDEEKNGFPENAQKFSDQLDHYDGFIVSLAEHNGSYAAAFKNIFDWVSRINRKVFRDKPLLLMTASPGGRGGASVLATANSSFPHVGANIVATFSLSNFYDNFKDINLVNATLQNELKKAVKTFEEAV